MILFIEMDTRINWRPGFTKNQIMCRGWWLWFAVGVIWQRFEQFACEPHDWVMDGRIVSLDQIHQSEISNHKLK
jgi:hypothetical protein